jgi:hypothetical protein
LKSILEARKSGFVRRNNVMRRETLWTGLSHTQVTIAAASTATLISVPAATILALRPYTVVRTRGILTMASDQTSASEDQEISYGHCVVSDQAAAIGVTAVPTPVTDLDSDAWYVYESMADGFSVTTDIGRINPVGRTISFDSKAMRKVEDGFQDIDVLETSSTKSPDASRYCVAQIQIFSPYQPPNRVEGIKSISCAGSGLTLTPLAGSGNVRNLSTLRQYPFPYVANDLGDWPDHGSVPQSNGNSS